MTSQEFAKFDATVRKILSVSHDEVKRREVQWKQQREIAKKKRAKISPASRASGDKG